MYYICLKKPSELNFISKIRLGVLSFIERYVNPNYTFVFVANSVVWLFQVKDRTVVTILGVTSPFVKVVN